MFTKLLGWLKKMNYLDKRVLGINKELGVSTIDEGMNFIKVEEKRLLDEYGCSNIGEVLIKQKQILEEKENAIKRN